MTIRKAIEIEGVLYIAAAAIISGLYVWNNNQIRLPILFENTSQAVVPQSFVNIRTETASQVSPDGTKKIIMNVIHNTDGTSNYTFFTADKNGREKSQIYKVKAESLEKYSIPFNAWSPDNKYFFIYKNSTNALVFRADGVQITEGEAYIDLASAFTAKNKTHSLKEVTGWADPALVVFNTLNQNGQKVSFWLEIPFKTVIPLSTQF